MRYLITAEAGHGMNTAGKRTPNFPDGSHMKENEFNTAALRHFKAALANTPNVEVYDVAPETNDTPLKTRTDRANAKYREYKRKYGNNFKSVHVSFHANAYLGYWGTWGGQGTFYHTNSTEGKKLALSVQKELVKGTKLRDRGAKSANFHVLRETIAPAVLVEAAFMDNMEEATLLRTDKFRKEVGGEVAQGVANYMGFSIKAPKPKPQPKPTKPSNNPPKGTVLRVVVGSYSERKNAEELQARLRAAGFNSFLVAHKLK